MKSSNDLWHGDEHLTDKPKTFYVRCSEIVHYEVEVEAMDEKDAEDLALIELQQAESLDNYIVDTIGFEVDSVEEFEPIKIGGTE